MMVVLKAENKEERAMFVHHTKEEDSSVCFSLLFSIFGYWILYLDFSAFDHRIVGNLVTLLFSQIYLPKKFLTLTPLQKDLRLKL